MVGNARKEWKTKDFGTRPPPVQVAVKAVATPYRARMSLRHDMKFFPHADELAISPCQIEVDERSPGDDRDRRGRRDPSYPVSPRTDVD